MAPALCLWRWQWVANQKESKVGTVFVGVSSPLPLKMNVLPWDESGCDFRISSWCYVRKCVMGLTGSRDGWSIQLSCCTHFPHPHFTLTFSCKWLLPDLSYFLTQAYPHHTTWSVFAYSLALITTRLMPLCCPNLWSLLWNLGGVFQAQRTLWKQSWSYNYCLPSSIWYFNLIPQTCCSVSIQSMKEWIVPTQLGAPSFSSFLHEQLALKIVYGKLYFELSLKH